MKSWRENAEFKLEKLAIQLLSLGTSETFFGPPFGFSLNTGEDETKIVKVQELREKKIRPKRMFLLSKGRDQDEG